MAKPASSPSSTPKVTQRAADRIFAGSARGAGITILVTLAAVTIFLLAEGAPALTADPEDIRVLSLRQFQSAQILGRRLLLLVLIKSSRTTPFGKLHWRHAPIRL